MARTTRSKTTSNPEYSPPLPTTSNLAIAVPQVSTSPPGSPELPQSPTNAETPSPSSGQNKKQKVEEIASSSSDTMTWVPTPDENPSPLNQEDEVEARDESSTSIAGPSSVHSSSRMPPPNFRPTSNPPYLQTFTTSSEEDELQPQGESSTFAASPHPTIGDEVQPQGESSVLTTASTSTTATTASTSITATVASSLDFSNLLNDRLYLTYRFYQVDHLHHGLFLTDHLNPCAGTLFHLLKDPPSDSWYFKAHPLHRIQIVGREFALFFLLPPLTDLITCINSPGHVATYVKNFQPVVAKMMVEKITKALEEVPTSKKERERSLGILKDGEEYGCRIWTIDALHKLRREGLVELGSHNCVIEDLMAEGRELACPGDPKNMAGDENTVKIINAYETTNPAWGTDWEEIMECLEHSEKF